MKSKFSKFPNTLENYEAHPEKQMAVIFLDAEKAFDDLNWNFMLHQLEVLQVGERFLKLIKAIYTQQKAKVNGELTKEIQIQKGIRQGCPRSPLLFILTLEILTEQIRDKKEIKGLQVRGHTYKLQAFALYWKIQWTQLKT